MFSYRMKWTLIMNRKNVCVGKPTRKLHHLYQKVFIWSAYRSYETFLAVKIKDFDILD